MYHSWMMHAPATKKRPGTHPSPCLGCQNVSKYTESTKETQSPPLQAMEDTGENETIDYDFQISINIARIMHCGYTEQGIRVPDSETNIEARKARIKSWAKVVRQRQREVACLPENERREVVQETFAVWAQSKLGPGAIRDAMDALFPGIRNRDELHWRRVETISKTLNFEDPIELLLFLGEQGCRSGRLLCHIGKYFVGGIIPADGFKVVYYYALQNDRDDPDHDDDIYDDDNHNAEYPVFGRPKPPFGIKARHFKKACVKYRLEFKNIRLFGTQQEEKQLHKKSPGGLDKLEVPFTSTNGPNGASKRRASSVTHLDRVTKKRPRQSTLGELSGENVEALLQVNDWLNGATVHALLSIWVSHTEEYITMELSAGDTFDQVLERIGFNKKAILAHNLSDHRWNCSVVDVQNKRISFFDSGGIDRSSTFIPEPSVDWICETRECSKQQARDDCSTLSVVAALCEVLQQDQILSTNATLWRRICASIASDTTQDTDIMTDLCTLEIERDLEVTKDSDMEEPYLSSDGGTIRFSTPFFAQAFRDYRAALNDAREGCQGILEDAKSAMRLVSLLIENQEREEKRLEERIKTVEAEQSERRNLLEAVSRLALQTGKDETAGLREGMEERQRQLAIWDQRKQFVTTCRECCAKVVAKLNEEYEVVEAAHSRYAESLQQISS